MTNGNNGRFFLSGWQAAIAFLFVTAAVALVLIILHNQTPGHATTLGLAYRMQATQEHLEAQLEDLRRRVRRLEGLDVELSPPTPSRRPPVSPGTGIR